MASQLLNTAGDNVIDFVTFELVSFKLLVFARLILILTSCCFYYDIKTYLFFSIHFQKVTVENRHFAVLFPR